MRQLHYEVPAVSGSLLFRCGLLLSESSVASIFSVEEKPSKKHTETGDTSSESKVDV
jgi:hypothetical protein